MDQFHESMDSVNRYIYLQFAYNLFSIEKLKCKLFGTFFGWMIIISSIKSPKKSHHAN